MDIQVVKVGIVSCSGEEIPEGTLCRLACRKVLDERLTPGVLVAFVLYIERFFDPIRDLSQRYDSFQSTMAGGEHVFALLDTPPDFPVWLPGLAPDAAGEPDQINAWLYGQYCHLPWATVHHNWRMGFLRLLQASQDIAEKDLLDAGKFSWMEGHPLAFVLVASYDHHQEHLDKLNAWLNEP